MKTVLKIAYVLFVLLFVAYTIVALHKHVAATDGGSTHVVSLRRGTSTVRLNSYEHTIYHSCVAGHVPGSSHQDSFIGHEHVMLELDIMKRAFLKDKKTLHLPNTMLLYGPPGTGKSTVAKQLSSTLGEDTIVLTVSMNHIENKYYGESLKLLHAVFSLAKKVAPCVLFFDEIDGFMSERSSFDQTHTNTMKTNLLLCVDDVLGRNDVIFIAATNRPRDLDPAFLRRMELHMELARPSTCDKLTLGRRHVPSMDESDVESLFDAWTLHDMNKFFRFVERRRWMDDLTDQPVDMPSLRDMHAVYVAHYLLMS